MCDACARARVARRYLYKLRGREACNFPVPGELAAELDGLTLEQIQARLPAAAAGALEPASRHVELLSSHAAAHQHSRRHRARTRPPLSVDMWTLLLRLLS